MLPAVFSDESKFRKRLLAVFRSTDFRRKLSLDQLLEIVVHPQFFRSANFHGRLPVVLRFLSFGKKVCPQFSDRPVVVKGFARSFPVYQITERGCPQFFFSDYKLHFSRLIKFRTT